MESCPPGTVKLAAALNLFKLNNVPRGQIQNYRFATDGILGDIFSYPEFPFVRLDTMNGFL